MNNFQNFKLEKMSNQGVVYEKVEMSYNKIYL